MRPRISEQIQQEIWDRSKTDTIGQMCKRFGLSRDTVKKYMNQKHQ